MRIGMNNNVRAEVLEGLQPGEVFIVRGEAKDAIVVPSSALGKRGQDGRHAVRVVGKDNKTEERQVRIGEQQCARRGAGRAAARRARGHGRFGRGGRSGGRGPLIMGSPLISLSGVPGVPGGRADHRGAQER